MIDNENPIRGASNRTVRWPLTAVASCGLVAVAALVALAFFGSEHGSVERRSDADVAVLQAARHHAVDLLSIDKADLDGYSERVLAEATGQWREDFLANRGALLGVLQGATEQATGVVSDAGIAGHADDGTVSVLLAAKVVPGADRDQQGTPVRMRLDIASAEDQLKLAKVEIVR